MCVYIYIIVQLNACACKFSYVYCVHFYNQYMITYIILYMNTSIYACMNRRMFLIEVNMFVLNAYVLNVHINLCLFLSIVL